jgi:hypothetical protein
MWIKDEWDKHYIQRAKETILTLIRLPLSTLPSSSLSHNSQMCQYRNQKPSASGATTTDSPVRPALVSVVDERAPMRFAVRDSIYKRKPPNAFSVEDEFEKYTSGSVSSEETDILQFWEVK